MEPTHVFIKVGQHAVILALVYQTLHCFKCDFSKAIYTWLNPTCIAITSSDYTVMQCTHVTDVYTIVISRTSN